MSAKKQLVILRVFCEQENVRLSTLWTRLQRHGYKDAHEGEFRGGGKPAKLFDKQFLIDFCKKHALFRNECGYFIEKELRDIPDGDRVIVIREFCQIYDVSISTFKSRKLIAPLPEPVAIVRHVPKNFPANAYLLSEMEAWLLEYESKKNESKKTVELEEGDNPDELMSLSDFTEKYKLSRNSLSWRDAKVVKLPPPAVKLKGGKRMWPLKSLIAWHKKCDEILTGETRRKKFFQSNKIGILKHGDLSKAFLTGSFLPGQIKSKEISSVRMRKMTGRLINARNSYRVTINADCDLSLKDCDE